MTRLNNSATQRAQAHHTPTRVSITKSILYTLLYLGFRKKLPQFPLDQEEVSRELAMPDRRSWLLMVFGIPLGIVLLILFIFGVMLLMIEWPDLANEAQRVVQAFMAYVENER